ncbi:MAG: HAMP domain-containing sensor histidine kinase [Sulfurospirillaceae bacterium]|nr:HAMP domain-containing sensor histidine kinase [Sulfurospirillaceae bacterium]MDD2827133.1 HAMP domain-containing sensor histidine kinase [Sulfurospirillaceae bacterium]
MNIELASDAILLDEVKRRFEQKNTTLEELEFTTKKLYDLNEKLKENDSVKGEFLSLIKNVFNNPISSLLNLSTMIQKNQDSPKTEKIKSFMNTELLKLDFQLNNIFTAAEIEAGEIGNYFSEVNVPELFNEVMNAFGYLIEEKSLVIEPMINLEAPIVSDAKKLHCIFANILSNACEYSFRGKKVVFRVDIEHERLVIRISNVGDVILKEYKKEVFNRFKKVDKQSKARESVEGLGLGLSVVNALVESLDGEIDYDSCEEETIFTITLKLHDKSISEALLGESGNEFMFDDFDDMKEF